MLSLLVDEHASPDVAVIVRRSRLQIPVFALLAWQEGIWIGESDEEFFRPHGLRPLPLVTYDERATRLRRLSHVYSAGWGQRPFPCCG